MNHQTAIQLAEQRMREIGKTPCEFHYEPISIIGTSAERLAGLIKLTAYNEYYYLINEKSHYGFQILSDIGYFNADDHAHNTIREHRGAILIKKIAASWSLEKSTSLGVKLFAIDFLRLTIH